ncbi:hypothetical protein NQ314_006720, partial [Rhamnusium bicolor]
EKVEKLETKKHFDREYSPILSDKSDGTEDIDLAEVDFFSEDGTFAESSRAASPVTSDCEDVVEKSRRHKGLAKQKHFVVEPYTGGLHNEIMIDPSVMKPCNNRIARCKLQLNNSKLQSVISDSAITKVYSDSSSDSGYDESSNQEMSSDNAFRKDQVGIEEINSQIPIIN